MLKLIGYTGSLSLNEEDTENCYFFEDNNKRLYFWKTLTSNFYNLCTYDGNQVGIDVLNYIRTSQRAFHNGKWFDGIKFR
jgi:hypothetical protein